MGDCQYSIVPNNEEKSATKNEKVQWKPFLKQILIFSGTCTATFLYGLCYGIPTVLIPQMRKEANNTDVITNDMASWLTSMHSFSGSPCVLIMSIITTFVGRKIPFTIAVIVSLMASVLNYLSSSVTHVLIAQIMQGVFTASEAVFTHMIVTEYTSPAYRGMFLALKAATFYWGVWVSNAIGTFFHWKTIPIIGICCAAYIIVTISMWPESPYWLASRQRYEQCASAHRWLKGCGEQSERELEQLIRSQKEYVARSGNANMSVRDRIYDFFKTIKTKDFYKPTLICFVTGIAMTFSGKMICVVYVLDILKKITNSESTAYMGMLILDGVTVFSTYAGCVLVKYVRRRNLLLVISSMAAMLLFVLSLYLYVIHLELMIENRYISLGLLSVYSITVTIGPGVVCMSVFGELLPIRSRHISVCLITIFVKLMNAVTMKSAPLLFSVIGLHGVFLIFGICVSVIIMILYKYLPETKDKTLQQIADSFKRDKIKSDERHADAKLM